MSPRVKFNIMLANITTVRITSYSICYSFSVKYRTLYNDIMIIFIRGGTSNNRCSSVISLLCFSNFYDLTAAFMPNVFFLLIIIRKFNLFTVFLSYISTGYHSCLINGNLDDSVNHNFQNQTRCNNRQTTQ